MKAERSLKGILTVEHRDKTGKVIDKDQVENVITKAGIAAAAALLLADVAEDAFDYIAIGTGTTAASSSDTTMETETHREAAAGSRTTDTITNDTAHLEHTFSGYSGTESITEAGALNAASGGDLLNRQVFTAKNVDWDAGDTLTIKIDIVNS